MSNFINTCAELRALLDKSEGNPIVLASGVEFEFHPGRTYNRQELENFEQKFTLRLPDGFKYFMEVVGASKLYVDEFGLGFDFIALEDWYDFSSQIYEGMRNPFPEICIFASNLGRGDMIGFDLRVPGNNNMAVFSHEDDPERWAEETKAWISFENWLIKLVKSEGEDDLVPRPMSI